MSILAVQRGSEATWLQEQPVATDLTVRPPASPDAARIPGQPPAIHDPDHVKRKPSITMTTTLSPPRETTIRPTVPTPRDTTITKPSRTTTTLRRLRTFLFSIPMEHELDTLNLRREITLHRLQLK